MICEHLEEFFAVCDKHGLQIASPDAIKVVCRQCEQQQVCPTSRTDGDEVIELPRPPRETTSAANGEQPRE